VGPVPKTSIPGDSRTPTRFALHTPNYDEMEEPATSASIMDSLTWAANAESNQRMLISLQYNGRVDGGGGCGKQVSGSQIAAFQPGLDIMIPPTSDQEDGTIPFTLFRYLIF
jgi:hypothetical protein